MVCVIEQGVGRSLFEKAGRHPPDTLWTRISLSSSKPADVLDSGTRAVREASQNGD